MKLFPRSRSGQTPPISLILVLVGFILLAFGFLAFRQLQGAQERRLRLLAGFGERVESAVENLSDRVVRIVKVPERARGQADGPDPQGQRDRSKVERYLEHVPHVSLIGYADGCSEVRERETEGSVDLWASGPSARLRYCPPEPPEPGPEEEEPRGYLAGIDLEGVIEPMIVPGAFDSILLADHRGEVLFQEGEPEVRILDLAPLVEASAGGGDGDDGPWWRGLLRERGAGVDPDALDRLLGEHQDRPLTLGGRTAMVEVAVAGTEYLVFLQPVSPGLEPPPRHGGGEPVRWIACGIISKENLWSAGLTTSPFLLFVLVSILPLAIVSWPFLKLSLITRRQPFRRLDLASLLFASVVGLALAALLAFDLLFVHRLHATVDDQLLTLTEAIAGRFQDEVLDAREQLLELNGNEWLWPTVQAGVDPEEIDCDGQTTREAQDGQATGGAQAQFSGGLGDLVPVSYIENPDNPAGVGVGGPVRPDPGRSASHSFIVHGIKTLLDPADLSTYPYFDSVFRATWDGRHGCANLPLREHAVLPQVIDDREYFRCARDCDPEPVFLELKAGRGGRVHRERWEQRCSAHVFDRAGDGNLPVCLHSLLDRTTGTSVAALALPTGDAAFPVTALVTRFTSVGHPVLPPDLGFAIVERGGRVLFHSEARRDLSESFLKASDEDPVLRSMLEDRRRGHLSLHYWGQPTRVHVKPLTGLPWSLVTFRNTYDLRVRNFELIYDFLNPFLLYLGALLLVAIVLLAFLPRRARRYLWPSANRHLLYRTVVGTTFAWVLLLLAVFLRGGPAGVFWISALGPAALLLAGVAAVMVERRRGDVGEGRRAGEIRPAHRSYGWLLRIREVKPRWLPLVVLLAVGILATACLLSTDARVLPVFVGGLALGLLAAVFWHWHSFQGERRKVAYVFAFGCVLLVAGLLPALGFLHLASSRQIQLHTQDAQVALARVLEARDREIAGRQGPVQDAYGHYEDDLKDTRDAYLRAVYETSYEDEPDLAQADPSMPWPYGGTAGGPGDGGEAEDQEGGERGDQEQKEARRPGAGSVARLLASRPFPVNDLSARPVESDLSRFGTDGLRWRRLGDGRPLLTYTGAEGTGDELHLASTIPEVGMLRELTPKILLLLLGLLLLAVSPFLLAHSLADRVLMISLVGEPAAKRLRRRTTAMSSTSLPLILDGVLDASEHTNEVVKQVVLVSTLPGPSAWSGLGLVEGDAEEPGGDRPRFVVADFGEAWRRAFPDAVGAEDPEGEGEEPGEAEPAPGVEDREGAPDDREAERPDRRARRFYDELLRGESREERAEQEGPRRGRPLLITRFAPDLENAKAAADQVAALRWLTAEDRRSVVILAETVPDPEIAGRMTDMRSRPAARRTWTDLLATYAVEYGHDSRTYDIEAKVTQLHDKIDGILRELDPPGAFREELHAIERNLRYIERECSPSPLLRNVGWSMLAQIEAALPRLRKDIEDARQDAVPDADQRDLQGRVEEAVRGMESLEPPDPEAEGEGDGDREAKLRARELVEVLSHAYEKTQNPVVLLRRAALSVTDDGGRGSELLGRLAESLAEQRPEGTADQDEGAEGEKTLWDRAIAFATKARDDLWREFVEVELRRRRIGRARKLLQLFTREHVVSKVGTEARLHYRYLWSRCTPDEKLVLVQLSEDGLVNPKYFGWLMDLMNRGLVVRDPEIRVMNESFSRFVLQEVQRSQIREWQEEEGPSGWSVLKWLLPAPLVLVAAFLFVTQRDALSNVTGVVIALVSLAPILFNLYGQFRQVSAQKEGAQKEGAEKEGVQKEGATAGGPS